jgi:hypothetical protein
VDLVNVVHDVVLLFSFDLGVIKYRLLTLSSFFISHIFSLLYIITSFSLLLLKELFSRQRE